MSSGFALQARGLRVRLGDVEVLHGAEVALRLGCWTAVVGPNGAGKTTLLKALAHLLPHGALAAGSVQLMGRGHAQWTARERARALAWLGQSESGADDLLSLDVVMLGRMPHQPWLGAPSADDHAAVLAAMQQTQSWDWRQRPLGSLSGGERQRVLLARALAVQAPLMLMDEPLANLDPPHQGDWLRIARAQVAAGGAVVSVLHELNMALQADEVVVMQAGRVVHQGSPQDAAARDALVAVFDGRVALHRLADQWVALPLADPPP